MDIKYKLTAEKQRKKHKYESIRQMTREDRRAIYEFAMKRSREISTGKENTMTQEKITVWVTRYWFTKGIMKYENAVLTAPDRVAVLIRNYWNNYFHGNEWHRTEAEARAHVEVLRQRKIESMEKRLERLRTEEIKVIEGK